MKSLIAYFVIMTICYLEQCHGIRLRFLPTEVEGEISADIAKDGTSFIAAKHDAAIKAGAQESVKGIKRTKIELAVNVYWDTYDKNSLGAVTKK